MCARVRKRVSVCVRLRSFHLLKKVDFNETGCEYRATGAQPSDMGGRSISWGKSNISETRFRITGLCMTLYI
jgi:hypothetical protein